jgi:site-specific recombinase XerD
MSINIENEFIRLRYQPRTIETYLNCLRNLNKYYASKKLEDLSFDNLSEYLDFLKNRMLNKTATIRINVAAFDAFYNRILNKNYQFVKLRIPKAERDIPEILDGKEINEIINSIEETKARLLVTLIYSAGLDLDQAVNLRVKDLDFDNKRIAVKSIKGNGYRYAVLADSLIDELNRYLKIYKPTQWLFEGRVAGQSYSKDAIQRNFKSSVLLLGIRKQVSIKTLKYSYVKHMEAQGIPLKTVLNEIELGAASVDFYSKINIHQKSIEHSPLDRIDNTVQEEIDTSKLSRTISQLKNESEKGYLLEAINCLNARAYRATVVFIWIACVHNIQKRCFSHSLNTVNQYLKKHNPKAYEINKIEDFSYINDNLLLQLCQDLGEFDKAQITVLFNCLDLRNQCGHPGKYQPKSINVLSYIEDTISIIFH